MFYSAPESGIDADAAVAIVEESESGTGMHRGIASFYISKKYNLAGIEFGIRSVV